MRIIPLAAALACTLLSGGCVSTVAAVVTAPVKVAGKAIDWSTTSQEEADRNYGRKMRKQEAREGRERKRAFRACRDSGTSAEECRRGYDGYRAGDERPR